MVTVGIDISTYVGICKLDGAESVSKTINFKGKTGFNRLQLIAQEVERTFDIWKPVSESVAIEHYAFGNRNSLVLLVEIGTIIRYVLHRRHIKWWEVPPTTLKKWLTGKGNAKKPDMALAVKNRWGYSSPSDDVIDAFALAQMCRYVQENGVNEHCKGVHLAV